MTKITRDVSDFTTRPITQIVIQGAAGSSINSIPIGNITPSTGAFTTATIANLITTGSVNFTGATITGLASYYADIAEKYAADMVLEAGDVVTIGGAREITLVTSDEQNAFGIITSAPAFIMNQTDDVTYYGVVMTGRVPAKVCGTAKKGQRLYSDGRGALSVVPHGDVLARALVDKKTTELGLIEVVTRIKL